MNPIADKFLHEKKKKPEWLALEAQGFRAIAGPYLELPEDREELKRAIAQLGDIDNRTLKEKRGTFLFRRGAIELPGATL